MKISPPLIITPRLEVGFQLSSISTPTVFVSIAYDGSTNDGRTRYRYSIDCDKMSHIGNDLKSGVGGGNLQEGLESLVCFMGACAETDSLNLFPDWVGTLLRHYLSELEWLAAELQERFLIQE